MKIIFQTCIIVFHVNFPGCISKNMIIIYFKRTTWRSRGGKAARIFSPTNTTMLQQIDVTSSTVELITPPLAPKRAICCLLWQDHCRGSGTYQSCRCMWIHLAMMSWLFPDSCPKTYIVHLYHRVLPSPTPHPNTWHPSNPLRLSSALQLHNWPDLPVSEVVYPMVLQQRCETSISNMAFRFSKFLVICRIVELLFLMVKHLGQIMEEESPANRGVLG